MTHKKEVNDRVWAAFRQTYGTESPHREQRLKNELEQLDRLGWHERFLALQMLTAKCRAAGCRYSTSLDGSMAAYVLGMIRHDPMALKVDWDADAPFRIEVGERIWDELRRSLARFAEGDMVESEARRGVSYILHPDREGGQEFRICRSELYTVMDEAAGLAGTSDNDRRAELWEGGSYHGYIPGFFDEMEEYELRHTKCFNITELTRLLAEMRQLPAARALCLASDYMDASSLLRRSPAAWFAAYLSRGQRRRWFDYTAMGQGPELCHRTMWRNRDRMFFAPDGEADDARRRNEVLCACEGAYQWGIKFLPPDLARSSRYRFLAVSPNEVLCPLEINCAEKEVNHDGC